MNKLILCEGKTDVILLGYYLMKTAEWTHCKKNKTPLSQISIDENHGEYAECYKKDEDYLLIFGVGGCSRFKDVFEIKFAPAIADNDISLFSKVAVILDRDTSTDSEILNSISQWSPSIKVEPKINNWVKALVLDPYLKTYERKLRWLVIILPKEQAGAMETALMEAISENERESKIILKSKRFVRDLSKMTTKYLNAERRKTKAALGVSMSVLSPEKCFTTLNELILETEWENFPVLQQYFQVLVKI